MANRGALESVTVTMRKHPAMLRLVEGKEDDERRAMVAQAEATEDKSTLEEKVLYEGPVRGVCALAPNNVNTMACTLFSIDLLLFGRSAICVGLGFLCAFIFHFRLIFPTSLTIRILHPHSNRHSAGSTYARDGRRDRRTSG